MQVTFYSSKGNKPVSYILKNVQSKGDFITNKKDYVQKALQEICARRYWNQYNLVDAGYYPAKIRYREVKEKDI